MGRCYDCGLDYQDLGWIEAIIPDQIWNDISPNKDQSGILCITCISRRLVKSGYKRVPVWLSGTEPLRPAGGDPCDDEASFYILRNWKPTKKRKEKTMKIGDVCIFVDRDGRERNAFVIWTWKTCLNIIYVDLDGITADSCGHGVIRETSVPYFEEGMKGFYIKGTPYKAEEEK